MDSWEILSSGVTGSPIQFSLTIRRAGLLLTMYLNLIQISVPHQMNYDQERIGFSLKRTILVTIVTEPSVLRLKSSNLFLDLISLVVESFSSALTTDHLQHSSTFSCLRVFFAD